MKMAGVLAAAALISMGLQVGTAAAQGAPQTVIPENQSQSQSQSNLDQPRLGQGADLSGLASGNRSSELVGSSVVSDANDTIGKIDDIIITPDGKAPYAILSVGGFLGMGSRLVAVPYSSLKLSDNKVTLPGASKDTLTAMPEFRYAK